MFLKKKKKKLFQLATSCESVCSEKERIKDETKGWTLE